MGLFFLAAIILLAISTLAAPGPVDMTFNDNAVEQPVDFNSLYVSDASKSAVCLQCECGKSCPLSCDCKELPAKPNTIAAPAGPDQHCTGTQQEKVAGQLCPWSCTDGSCLCYNYCSRNYCVVYGPDGTTYEFEGRCVSARVPL